MRDRDIDPDRALCFTLATTGFKVGRDKIMALSLASSRLEEPGNTVTHYIAGAELDENIQEVTGVTTPYYNQRCVGMKRAEELTQQVAIESSCLITYTYSKFHSRWMEELPPVIKQLPVLDILNVYKTLEAKQSLPEDLDTITDLQNRLEVSVRNMRQGWALDAVCNRVLPRYRGEPRETKTEQRIQDLWMLWHAALDRRT
jgi:hypothetical protein